MIWFALPERQDEASQTTSSAKGSPQQLFILLDDYPLANTFCMKQVSGQMQRRPSQSPALNPPP